MDDDLSIDELESELEDIEDEIAYLERHRDELRSQLFDKRDRPKIDAQKKLARWTGTVVGRAPGQGGTP